MRDRLIELLNVLQDFGTKHFHGEWVEKISSTSNEIIADYLLENGVIAPPCKVGDMVYVVKPYFSHIQEYEVRGYHLGEFPTLNGHKRNPYLICCFKSTGMLKNIFIKDIGKTVFLTREEAEQALKGGAE